MFPPRLILALLASLTTIAALMVVAPASAVISEPYLYQPVRYGVITDPSESVAARSLTMRYNVQNPTQDVTWGLRDAQDDVVLGPYDLGSKTGGSYGFVFDPTTLNSGVALPDGAYKIALTVSQGGESSTVDVTIHLAFDPPGVSTVGVLESQRDVWPGFQRRNQKIADYSRARIVTRLLPGVVLPEFGSSSPGTFRIRTLAGTLVRRDTVSGSTFGDGGTHDRYEWTWDGKNGNGRVQKPGEYRLTLTASDNWGRATTVPAGSMWVGHLANLTKTARFEPQEARNGYGNVIGRCSSVTYPGPHSWPGSAGLLSNSLCSSRAGQDDQAFSSFVLRREAYRATRLVSVRVDAYGVPVRQGQYATLVLDKVARGISYKRIAVLGNGERWHNGTLYRPAPERARGQLGTRVQVRVTNGNKYDLKYLRVTWVYRGWTR